MTTATELAEVALALALQGRTDEAAHVLGQLNTGEREELRRALTGLLLLWGQAEESSVVSRRSSVVSRQRGEREQGEQLP